MKKAALESFGDRIRGLDNSSLSRLLLSFPYIKCDTCSNQSVCVQPSAGLPRCETYLEPFLDEPYQSGKWELLDLIQVGASHD